MCIIFFYILIFLNYFIEFVLCQCHIYIYICIYLYIHTYIHIYSILIAVTATFSLLPLSPITPPIQVPLAHSCLFVVLVVLRSIEIHQDHLCDYAIRNIHRRPVGSQLPLVQKYTNSSVRRGRDL